MLVGGVCGMRPSLRCHATCELPSQNLVYLTPCNAKLMGARTHKLQSQTSNYAHNALHSKIMGARTQELQSQTSAYPHDALTLCTAKLMNARTPVSDLCLCMHTTLCTARLMGATVLSLCSKTLQRSALQDSWARGLFLLAARHCIHRNPSSHVLGPL